MKSILLASVALLAISGAASAAALSVTYKDLPANGSYYAPEAIFATQPYEEGVTGSITGLRLSPFGDNTTPYDAVEANGSATFGFPFISAFAARSARVAAPFGTGNGSFTFVWGSPDTYNVLTFYDFLGQEIGSVTGSGSPSTGAGGYLATVSGIGEFSSVRLESQGANAFEFAAVSSVPLPASAPMFGAALLALAGFGYGMNRWVAPKGRKAVPAV